MTTDWRPITRPKTCVIGLTGRLGGVLGKTLQERGDELIEDQKSINYLIFAHRYRGRPSFELEMETNLNTLRIIENVRWGFGDCSCVIVSSVCASDPVTDQPLSYNVSKAAQLQFARYYAKTIKAARFNTVSPAGFTGNNPPVLIQQVADVIAFLCSPKSSGINGQDIKICG